MKILHAEDCFGSDADLAGGVGKGTDGAVAGAPACNIWEGGVEGFEAFGGCAGRCAEGRGVCFEGIEGDYWRVCWRGEGGRVCGGGDGGSRCGLQVYVGWRGESRIL